LYIESNCCFMDQTLQSSLLTSDDVAKGPRGTNVPMAVKFNPDG
jgi:hypothetical protein